MQLSLAQLQAALGAAQLHGAAEVRGVCTDSRKLAPGDLFVALRGERFDAHDFLPQAAAAGAAAVVAERLPEPFDLPALLVPDTHVALLEIARYWRSQFQLPLIAVTGSNGKTTVKEMIAAILAAAFGAKQRLATSGNLNNEVGVPLTLLRLAPQHRAAVVELGMNHPGEIARLAAAALPDVALVNNAQREHQEFMHSVAAVAEENGSVLRALPEHGVAVFPSADAFSALWRAIAGESGQRRVVTFGLDDGATVGASYQAEGLCSRMQIRLDGKIYPLCLQAAGEHNVLNALAAAACCLGIGIAPETIVRGLENFEAVNGRLQRKQAAVGATLIDDTYNANPDSVRAAIDVLAPAGAAAYLVLGDMGEVGDQGAEFHREIGAYARARGIGRLFALGSMTADAVAAFGSGARHFERCEDLLAALDAAVDAGTTVLVKGSRFMKMERVVAHLQSGAAAAHETQHQQGTH